MSNVYIDDVVIFSKNIDSHFKHLNTFFKMVNNNGLVVSAKKMVLFQTTISFLEHDLYQGSYKPICRGIEFSSKFPNEILDKTQLQRFLGSLMWLISFQKSDMFVSLYIKDLEKTLFLGLLNKPRLSFMSKLWSKIFHV